MSRLSILPHPLRVAAAILAVSLCVVPVDVALAAGKGSVATKLVTEAAKAIQNGDFARAIELYKEALSVDSRPEHLWLLARAEHQAGHTERALEHYHAFLAAPGAASDHVADARKYAADIDRERLEARVQQVYVDAFQRGQIQEAQLRAVERTREWTRLQEADAAARTGDYKAAAKLYLTAYQTTRDRDDQLLFKAAVAEQDAQQWHVAAGHFEEYVKRASPTATTYSEAVTRLEALRRRLGLASAVAQPEKPQPKATVPAEAPKDDDPATIGWSLVKIGGAVALVGLGSYVWTYSQQADLDALLRVGPNGKIHDISREAAAQRVQAVNTHVVTALVVSSVGVAAAGVGAYLILRTPTRVAVTPGPVPAGIGLAWRF